MNQKTKDNIRQDFRIVWESARHGHFCPCGQICKGRFMATNKLLENRGTNSNRKCSLLRQSHVENYYQIIKKKCSIFLNPLAFQLTFTKENVPLSPIVFDKDWSNSLSLKRIYNTLFDSDFYLYLNFISIRNCLN